LKIPFLNIYSVSVSIFQLKKFQTSVDDCTAALNLDGNYAKAQLRRAKSYMEMVIIGFALI